MMCLLKSDIIMKELMFGLGRAYLFCERVKALCGNVVTASIIKYYLWSSTHKDNYFVSLMAKPQANTIRETIINHFQAPNVNSRSDLIKQIVSNKLPTIFISLSPNSHPNLICILLIRPCKFIAVVIYKHFRLP